MSAELPLKAGFTWPVRVYYEDTDAAGIVYHANYLRFMERARTEWLRSLGFEQDQLAENEKVVFVIYRSDVEYLKAARFNEMLEVHSSIKNVRGAIIEFAQSISNLSSTLVCRARNHVACVDVNSLAPRRIPRPLIKVINRGY